MFNNMPMLLDLVIDLVLSDMKILKKFSVLKKTHESPTPVHLTTEQTQERHNELKNG